MHAKEEDRKFDARVEALQEKMRKESSNAGSSASALPDKEALRKALQSEINKEFESVQKNRKEQKKTEVTNKKTDGSEEQLADKKQEPEAEKNTVRKGVKATQSRASLQKQSVEKKAKQKNIGTSLSPGSEVRPQELLIHSSIQPGFRISEGEPLRLAAELVFSGGSTRDVTSEAVWRVLGDIGSMREPGLFIGKLSPSIAEFGHGPGNIIVTWKDPKNPNTVLFDKTPVFEVEFKVPDSSDERG